MYICHAKPIFPALTSAKHFRIYSLSETFFFFKKKKEDPTPKKIIDKFIHTFVNDG